MTSSIEPIVKAVTGGEQSARSFVEAALEKAEETKEYNALISTIKDRALARADEIDKRVKNGETLPLAGVPFIAKDNFLTFGSETTAASDMLKDFQAPYQSTAIEKLEAAGAICIGKANLDAFAHGSSTENSDFGPTKNPHDPTRVPGGSSGGSAAAVALDVAPFALGTDTGGSIRLPASFCGVVGVKPTYGLVSRYGVVAMASSTDVIGPFAKSAYDAALVMNVLAGKDERDGTTIEPKETSYTPSGKKQLRIGVVEEFMGEGVEPAVKAVIEKRIEQLKSEGYEVSTVSIPLLSIALAIYYVIVPAELSSNLARYDGIKYGYRNPEAKSLSEVYELSRSQGLNAENKRRIMIGNYVLSSGYYDAYYRKAQTARTLLSEEFTKAFETCDVLVGPVAPGVAFKIGQKADDPLAMYLNDIMTVAVNLVGVPALSIPAGEANNLPVGLQLIGKMNDDKTILNLAHELEELGT